MFLLVITVTDTLKQFVTWDLKDKFLLCEASALFLQVLLTSFDLDCKETFLNWDALHFPVSFPSPWARPSAPAPFLTEVGGWRKRPRGELEQVRWTSAHDNLLCLNHPEYDIRGDSGSVNRRTANLEPMVSSIARGPVVHPCIAPEPHAGGKCTKRTRHPKSRDTNTLSMMTWTCFDTL